MLSLLPRCASRDRRRPKKGARAAARLGLPKLASAGGRAGREALLAVMTVGVLLGPAAPAAAGDKLTTPRIDRALLDRIESATMLVLVKTPDGVGYGSGFLVAPDLVVTNAHIAPKSATDIYVSNIRLKAPLRASLLASENRGLLKRDLALLKLDHALAGGSPPPLAHGVGLSGVYAAGFPKLPIHHQLTAFFETGAAPAPRLPTATFGIATSRDEHRGTTILSHTAATAKGSSGGPVIDECGRVVGMASWVRDDRVGGGDYRVNLAQGAEMIQEFLEENSVDIPLEKTPCAP